MLSISSNGSNLNYTPNKYFYFKKPRLFIWNKKIYSSNEVFTKRRLGMEHEKITNVWNKEFSGGIWSSKALSFSKQRKEIFTYSENGIRQSFNQNSAR